MNQLLKHRYFQLGEFAAAIINHANSSPAREVCGAILRDGSIVQLTNHSEQGDQFEMGAEFEQFRERAVAIYHSHVGLEVGAQLSPADIQNSKEQGIPYLSYHPQHRQWDYFDPGALHPFPMEMDQSMQPQQTNYYLLWRFEYGRSDCYSLVRSWYAGMLGIALGDYPRIELDKVIRLGLEQFGGDRTIAEGFEKLTPDTLIQDHDILLIDMGARRYRGHHLAIVCDAASNQILHNTGEGQYSQIASYNLEWRDRTRAIFRHKQL